MTALLSNSFSVPASETRAKPNGAYQLHSLDRAISVLEVLRESDVPLSLAEICLRMNLHKSTAHRSLMVLERSALIERTQENRFRLGLKLYELGNRRRSRSIYAHESIHSFGASPCRLARRST